jgi:hypothetical protein
LLMLQRKGSRICSFNHGWALRENMGALIAPWEITWNDQSTLD